MNYCCEFLSPNPHLALGGSVVSYLNHYFQLPSRSGTCLFWACTAPQCSAQQMLSCLLHLRMPHRKHCQPHPSLGCYLWPHEYAAYALAPWRRTRCLYQTPVTFILVCRATLTTNADGFWRCFHSHHPSLNHHLNYPCTNHQHPLRYLTWLIPSCQKW